MKNKKFISMLAAVALSAASVGNAIACTTLMVSDLNGNYYHGRTVEFTNILPLSLSYIPSGTKIQSITPDSKPGKAFDTKYGFISLTLPANWVPNNKNLIVAEGANDQGVSFTVNAFIGSTTPPITKSAANVMSVGDLGSWILGTFKSVAEAKAALTSGNTDIWLPVLTFMDNQPFPMHYAVFDKKGGAIVIEFDNNKMNVYDNPVYAMTNTPDFPWHLKNLNNYTFNNVDKNTGQLGKLKLFTQDAGIALTMLPGAETAQGRFVKAAFYANYVRKAKTPDEAVVTLGHIMNNFDRPYDLTVAGSNAMGDGPTPKGSTEVTTHTILNDLSRNLFYLRTINSLNFSVIDINKLKDVKQIKTLSSLDVDKAGGDVFSLFYK